MEERDSMIGKLLDHYRILAQIGQGGMGVVYRAHDEVLDRDVAVKVLAAGTVREALDLLGSLYPGIRDRIFTEQGALRQHINIFVGSEDVRYTGGLNTPLPASAVISIVPAISGG